MDNRENSSEIVLSDIIKMFKGKSKQLLCVIIICGLLGGVFELVRSFVFGSYGNTVKFYLTVTDGSANLLPLLQSESFAEKLLLDENGLPPKELCDHADYDAALEAVTVYNNARENAVEARKERDFFKHNTGFGDYNGKKMNTWDGITEEYTRLQEEITKAQELLAMYKNAFAEAVAQEPGHIAKTAEYENNLTEAIKAKEEFESDIYTPALEQKNSLDRIFLKKLYLLKNLRENAEVLTEKVVSGWRNNKDIEKDIRIINEALTIEYATEEADGSDGEEIKNIAFINVDVSVPTDREFAEFILERIKLCMPDYVEKNIEKLVGSIDAKCTLITPFSQVKNLETDGLAESIISRALIFAAAGGALYFAAVAGKGYINKALEA